MIRRDPICTDANHRRVGIVTSGSFDGAHASTQVCGNRHCQADAKEWAESITRLRDARFVPDPPEVAARVAARYAGEPLPEPATPERPRRPRG